MLVVPFLTIDSLQLLADLPNSFLELRVLLLFTFEAKLSDLQFVGQFTVSKFQILNVVLEITLEPRRRSCLGGIRKDLQS